MFSSLISMTLFESDYVCNDPISEYVPPLTGSGTTQILQGAGGAFQPSVPNNTPTYFSQHSSNSPLLVCVCTCVPVLPHPEHSASVHVSQYCPTLNTVLLYTCPSTSSTPEHSASLHMFQYCCTLNTVLPYRCPSTAPP